MGHWGFQRNLQTFKNSALEESKGYSAIETPILFVGRSSIPETPFHQEVLPVSPQKGTRAPAAHSLQKDPARSPRPAVRQEGVWATRPQADPVTSHTQLEEEQRSWKYFFLLHMLCFVNSSTF